MENTTSMLFEDDQPQWFVVVGDDWVGPQTATEVYEKILSGEITWAHFIWKAGQKAWARICDVPVFRAAVPSAPGSAVRQEVKAAAKPAVKKSTANRAPAGPTRTPPPPQSERTWFLYYNEAQYGPFSNDEVKRSIELGKIGANVHAWKDGMENWEKLSSVPEFQGELKKGKGSKSSSARSEQRQAPRRPLIARILLANAESVIVGMCRDISIGGMQVLTDQIPGEVGARVKLNVSPSNGGQPDGLKAFVAEGVLVRILEDKRGFSFRFEKIEPAARDAIDRYTRSA